MMRPRSPRTGAVILSAGESRRMHGRHKALLRFGKMPFILHIIRALRNFSPACHLVVVLGHHHEAISELLEQHHVTLARNERGQDQFSSIQCGLNVLFEQVPAVDAVFLCPIDQPIVPVPLLESLIEAWRQSDAAGVIPTYGGKGGHPVLLDSHFARTLPHLSSAEGLRGILKHRPDTLRLVADYPDIVNNINTVEAYDAFCQSHAIDGHRMSPGGDEQQ